MQWSLAKSLLVGGLLLSGSGAVSAQLFPDAFGAPFGATPVDRRQAPRSEGQSARAPDPAEQAHSFYFTRAMYSGSMGRWGRAWQTDYPKAERQFLTVLRRLTSIDAYEHEHPLRLDDPNLRRFPFVYAVEVGYMSLSDAEVAGLRDYLLAGGFFMADDFWGTQEWNSFEQQMSRVLPEHPIVEIPLDHPIFSSLYETTEIIQVPNGAQGMAGGRTHERDGFTPHVRGIFDDKGRLMVVINWNTDLADGWEWAEQPRYPLRFSTFAYQMGANFIVYAMSH